MSVNSKHRICASIVLISILLAVSMYYSSYDKYLKFTLEANNSTMYDSTLSPGRETYDFDLQPGSYRFTFQGYGAGSFSLYSPRYGSEHNEAGRNFASVNISGDTGRLTTLSFETSEVIRGARLRVTGDVTIEYITGESVGLIYYDQIIIAVLILLAGAAVMIYARRQFEKFAYDPERIIHVLGLLLAVLISTLALMRYTVQWAHDVSFHLVRIEGVYESLKSGQFPARMDMTFIKGYGYADQIMYPTLFLYFPAMLRLLRVSSITSYQIFMLAINCATAGISYFAFSRLLKSRHLGFMTSAAYTLATYRIICIFTRAAVGELIAMAFLPLVLYGMYTLFYDEKPVFYPLVIGFTGIINSHVVSLDMVIVFCAIAFFVNIKRLTCEHRLGRIAACAAVTIILNLWVLVPLYQMGNTGMRITSGEPYYSAGDAVFPFEMFATFISSMGLSESLEKPYTGMPLTVGLFFGLALVVFWGMRIMERRKGAGVSGRVESLSRNNDLAVRCSVLALLALYIASTLFPWSVISAIPYIGRIFTAVQFPWRYFGIASIALAVVFAVTLDRITMKLPRYAAAIIALSVMIVSAAPYIDNYMQDTSRPAILSDKWTKLDTSYIGGWEYLYLNCYKTWFEDSPRNITVIDGTAGIDNLSVHGTTIEFDAAPGSFGKLVIPSIAYPGYRVTANGVEIQNYGFASDFGAEYQNQTDNGLIKVSVYTPADEPAVHYKVEWKSPAVWRISELISLTAAVILIASYIIYRNKRPQRMLPSTASITV